MKAVDVILASTNEGKVRELAVLFAEPRLQLVGLRGRVPAGFEVDETGQTFEENAWLKALAVCAETGLPALADDSGLEVDALDGRPGVWSARYAGAGADDAANNALLLRELADVPEERRTARFVSVLAFAAPSPSGPVRVAASSGRVEGRILREPRGANGFGYDPLFAPLAFPDRTTAEMSLDEKNSISHRAAAARAIAPSISAWLDDFVTRTTGAR